MTRNSLRLLLLFASALALIGYVMLAWQMIAGGAPADPLETAILDQAASLAHHPTLDPGSGGSAGAPLPPAFPLIVAWLVGLFGAHVWVPRLVSVLATGLAALAVESIVHGETESPTLGAAAAGLLLMSQAPVGVAAFARLEPLALLLAIGGGAALRYTAGVAGALLASALLTAAGFSHPLGLALAGAVLFHLGVHDRRRLIACALGGVAFTSAIFFGLAHQPGSGLAGAALGLGLATLHFEPVGLLQFIGVQMLGTLGVFTLATVLSFALPVRPWQGAVGIWTWLALASLIAGVVATQAGAAPLDAMRSVAVILAIVGPVSARRITQHLSNWPGGSRAGGEAVVLTALALQFVTLFASSAT